MLIEFPNTPRQRYHGGLPLAIPIRFAGDIVDGEFVPRTGKLVSFHRHWGSFTLSVGNRAYRDAEGDISWQAQFELAICWLRGARRFRLRLAPS